MTSPMQFCSNCDNLMYLRVVLAPAEDEALAKAEAKAEAEAKADKAEAKEEEDDTLDEDATLDAATAKKVKEVIKDKLQHYCRNCGHTTEITTSVVFRQDGGTNTSFEPSNYLNELSKYDPTLPVAKISCPCSIAGAGLKDAVYVRYDNSNMKYLFMCNTCNQYSLADKKTNVNDNI